MAGFSKDTAQDPSAASAYASPQQWHGHQMQGQAPNWSDQWRQRMSQWHQQFPTQPGQLQPTGPMPPPMPQTAPQPPPVDAVPSPALSPSAAPSPVPISPYGPHDQIGPGSNAALAQALQQPASPAPVYGVRDTLMAR